MKLNKVLRVCGLASLILIAGSLVTLMAADIQGGKGAARLLMKPVAQPTTVTSAAMACTRCTDNYTSVKELTARGANKPVMLVARHGCGGCSTMISAVGVGKAKQNVALHTCTYGAAQKQNCCSAN